MRERHATAALSSLSFALCWHPLCACVCVLLSCEAQQREKSMLPRRRVLHRCCFLLLSARSVGRPRAVAMVCPRLPLVPGGRTRSLHPVA
uniref:Putative secreted protein n=1 Tax=Anopheles darlingi TaxID=43151 RepID=A0A2M4D725_ANODA